ncbi:MAG: endonuclease MutS2 [Lachnospiraceae bacterium]|nr:endonuclease MutS2 [Lachnospiraceae bacterium]
MNEKALKTLEYDKVIAMLVEQASSDPGRKLCRELLPCTEIETIRTAMQETTDAAARLREKGHISFGDTRDLGGCLKRLEIQASLSMAELLYISRLLSNVKRVHSFGSHEKDGEASSFDSLEAYFKSLDDIPTLNRAITGCIIDEDTMADDASPELKSIRRKRKSITDHMHTELNAILNAHRMYLQDAVIAIRDGAYCLPVKAEYKGQVPGVIHDQSATGSTIFIEPMAVIRFNNTLRELDAQEKTEIAKILDQLTEQAVPCRQTIETDIKLMSHLDFVFAKANLSSKMRGEHVELNDHGIIELRQARHPLLKGHAVVPIDISLGNDYDLLIITGPNTGGKTVSLKTVGLLTLMAQSGLHIPAFQNSKIAVFQEVYADIGDEQSIEQSLSTFSGHMKNIVEIVDKADRDSLCLFDELGAGTDPTEGAALAISVLNFLHNLGVRAIATTHYSELKVYALTTPGVENASCEFDVETLRPTYRILTGIPGKSNAFAISRRLGLPEFIIEDAGKHIEKNDAAFEDLIAKLNADRQIIERDKIEIEKNKREIEELKKRRAAQNENLDERREKILREAREEASRILIEAKTTADETIRSINKISHDSGVSKRLEKERARIRESLNRTLDTAPVNDDKDLDMASRLMNAWSGKSTPDSQTSSKKPGQGKRNIPERHTTHVRAASISPEINLIGKNVDEACAELDKYLDDALLSHLPRIRIIHGRGTGALRNGIHSYLKRQKFVKSFHLAEFDDGGDAITVVEF